MKKNLTELVFILDKSGSMHGLERDTVGGFNSTLDKQKELEGEVLVSTVLFNNYSKVIHDRVPLDMIPKMTEKDYYVGGSTALMDALGDAIKHISLIHKYAREEDVPEHTVFIITTDGMENASHRYTAEQVRQKIERQKQLYGWEFIFLGANIDAVETAGRIGIDKKRAVSYYSDHIGTQLNYEVISDAVCCMRESASIPDGWADRIAEDYQQRKDHA